MMKTSYSNTTFLDAETLLRLVTETYQTYLNSLETFSKTVPDSDTETLNRLAGLIQEAQKAMEYDLSLFDKAVYKDKESLRKLHEQLKIVEIRKQLSK